MNRQKLREIQNLPLREFERAVNQVIDDERDSIKRFAYNDAWASMFTALVNRFPDLMTGDMLHSIAADTIDIRNGIKPPEELIADLKERTGFDMSMPPHSDEGHRYIEIEEYSEDTLENVNE